MCRSYRGTGVLSEGLWAACLHHCRCWKYCWLLPTTFYNLTLLAWEVQNAGGYIRFVFLRVKSSSVCVCVVAIQMADLEKDPACPEWDLINLLWVWGGEGFGTHMFWIRLIAEISRNIWGVKICMVDLSTPKKASPARNVLFKIRTYTTFWKEVCILAC